MLKLYVYLSESALDMCITNTAVYSTGAKSEVWMESSPGWLCMLLLFFHLSRGGDDATTLIMKCIG
jgi:hypothetical protein